jgi:AcrR family transcriptional regulator
MYYFGMKRTSTGKSAEDQPTVTRLLDAAEHLFGELGYDAVGMRLLAEKAGVNLGAATYHFGTKEALYVETFMRRFRPTNAERLELLKTAGAKAGGKPLRVEAIVECMLRPPFESGLKHPAFHRFLARNLLMPPPFIHAAIIREVEPSMRAFIEVLKRSLPDVPEDLIHLRTMFAMGSLLMFTIHASELPGMNNPKLHKPLLREIIGYVSAGLNSAPVVPASERRRLPFPSKRSKR